MLISVHSSNTYNIVLLYAHITITFIVTLGAQWAATQNRMVSEEQPASADRLTGLILIVSHTHIILLHGSQVLTSLRKPSLIHALTHVPGNKGTLGLHQDKLAQSQGLSDDAVLRLMQAAHGILARSPPGSTVGGW